MQYMQKLTEHLDSKSESVLDNANKYTTDASHNSTCGAKRSRNDNDREDNSLSKHLKIGDDSQHKTESADELEKKNLYAGMILAVETTNDILKAALKKNSFEPTKNLRKMTDGIQMFAASYTKLNQYRKENFKPVMVGKFKRLTYTNNSVSDKLFGDDLQKKIEDIQKSRKYP
ncbi:unnamed protein product [Mytilus coruscus]|uniref:Uncharacterized protein n=1 Tax=Mytilus coruscus TaxID=42192 RepID=A0A6J7ZZP0_MYTCO|nr:unnamed protein product [Mytilus coruscus]